MTIKFPTKLRRGFVAEAKKVFPAETFAVLVGKKNKDDIEVTGMFFPPTVATEEFVAFDGEVYDEVQKEVKGEGLRVVGDLHSHCYPESWGINGDASPSEGDIDSNDSTSPLVRVQGICTINERGGKKRSHFRFYPRITPIELTA